MQLTLEVRDQESGEYAPVPNGNGIRLRVYTLGLDQSSQAAGLAVATNTWTLTFANMDLNEDGSATTDDKITAPTTANYDTLVYDRFRLSVAVIGIDNVENTAATMNQANTL